MAVGFDVATESHAGTTGHSGSANFSWSHTGGGSARGALVFVFGVVTNATPPVTSVTYGGTTMTAIPYTAKDTDTEPGQCTAYYLDNCGTGTKTVQVNRSDSTPWTHVLYAVCYTVTAATATEVYLPGVKTYGGSSSNTGASTSGTGTGTLAETTVDDGSPGTNSLRFMGRYQGTSNVTAAGANSTAPASAAASIDFGLYVIDTFYETTAGQGARNVGGATITDDVAAIALAVRELAVTTVSLTATQAVTTTAQTAAAKAQPAAALATASSIGYQPTWTVTSALSVNLTATQAVTATALDSGKTAAIPASLATTAAAAQQPTTGNRDAALATGTAAAFAAALIAKSGSTLAAGTATAQTPGPSVAFSASPVIGG